MNQAEKSKHSTVEARKSLLTQNKFSKVSDILRTNITNRRNQLHLTQRQLAEAAGVSQGVIYQLETGRVGRDRTLVRFSMTTVVAVAKVLRVPVWALFVPEFFLESVEGTNWYSLASAIGQLSDADSDNRSMLGKLLSKKATA